MSVNMYSALPMHERSKREDEESDVGTFATFINVQPPDVVVIVDVV